MEHECKQEDKIDNLLEITTKVHLAICGNGVPGIHDRLTKVENTQNNQGQLLTFAVAVGAGIGTIIGYIITIIKIGTV